MMNQNLLDPKGDHWKPFLVIDAKPAIMKIAEAKRLDKAGELKRRVMTEHGWYAPSYGDRAPVVEEPKSDTLHLPKKAK